MPFTLNTVVPWGRSLDEYERMFALSAADLTVHILGCADGPASFNAEATRRSVGVVSFDPLYEFTAAEIRARVDATYAEVIDQTRKNQHEFIWNEFATPDALGRARLQAMETFLADYPAGLSAGRYVAGAMPSLPFPDRSFDLALCSHFLFLYSEQFSAEFHVESILEMVRVAGEARIFPLVALGGTKSKHLETVLERLRQSGCRAQTQRVPYEFVRGANEMLRVYAAP